MFVTQEKILFILFCFTVLALNIGFFCVTSNERYINDHYQQSLQDLQTIKKEEDNLLIRIFSKKNARGEYIWLIVLGCLFFLWALVRLFLLRIKW